MEDTSKTCANENGKKIGIVGSGLIGRSWAMLFASAGYSVKMYDVDAGQVVTALNNILVQLKDLKSAGLLKGKLTIEEQHHQIAGTDNLQDCVQGTVYVQECVPENFELKMKVFAQIDEFVDNKTVVASSTSSMPCSTFTEKLKHRSQCIVAHPCNPPFYCPLVEVVPAPYTQSIVTDFTMDILKEIGEEPVLLNKELPGFALNRIQYALMGEVWRLIGDDAIEVEDIDKVMSDGLGMRYAFIGPLETCHLNADGFLDYCKKYGKGIYDISSQFGPAPEWEGPLAEKIIKEMNERIPVKTLVDRRKWRDARLSALAKLKLNMK